MSTDFFTRLEDQLREAAERDVALSPAGRRVARGRAGSRAAGRGLVAAMPVGLALACVALIAAVALSLGQEDDTVAGRGVAGPAPAAQGGPLGPAVDATVLVLNGTPRNGLAAGAADRLDAAGARIVGTATFSDNAVRVSRVYYADEMKHLGDAADVADRLAIGTNPRPLIDAIRTQAPRAEVVVVLGEDFAGPKEVRGASLTGPGGARGTLTLRETTTGWRLVYDATGLPPGSRYLRWAETRAGTTIQLGVATYDERTKRLAGALARIPSNPADLRRFYVTREDGGEPGDSAGPVVLDSGRLWR